MSNMNKATRSEVVFAMVMEQAPNLIENEDDARLGRYFGNVAHYVGPPFQVFMMSAGQDEAEYVTVGIGKNLPARIRKLTKASPIRTRVAIYTMVPTFKLALQLQKEVVEYLQQLFPSGEGNKWYWVPEGNVHVATKVMTDVAGDHDFATALFRFDPNVKGSALEDLKGKLIALRDEFEERIGGVM